MDGFHVWQAVHLRLVNYFICSLSLGEKKAINYIREKALSTALFTIEVLNLPKGKPIDQLRGALWTHFQKVVNFIVSTNSLNFAGRERRQKTKHSCN